MASSPYSGRGRLWNTDGNLAERAMTARRDRCCSRYTGADGGWNLRKMVFGPRGEVSSNARECDPCAQGHGVGRGFGDGRRRAPSLRKPRHPYPQRADGDRAIPFAGREAAFSCPARVGEGGARFQAIRSCRTTRPLCRHLPLLVRWHGDGDPLRGRCMARRPASLLRSVQRREGSVELA